MKTAFTFKIDKKLGILIFLAMLVMHIGYAQTTKNVIILNKPYYTVFFKSLITRGGPIQIEEYVHPEIYDKAQQAFENEDYDTYRRYAEKADETKAVLLNPGNYQLQSKERTFEFTVNESGFIEGKSTLEILTVPTHYKGMTFNFESKPDGKLSSVMVKWDGQLITEITYTQEIFTSKRYGEDGKLEEERIDKLPKNERENAELISETSYYPNGKVKARNNYEQEIYESFYEDGTKEEYRSKKPYVTVQYDEQGKITARSFEDKKENRCEEIFENGVIVHRTCENKLVGSKPYEKIETYKNGKLVKYTIKENGKEKNYNASGKLLSEKEYTAPPPPAMIKVQPTN